MVRKFEISTIFTNLHCMLYFLGIRVLNRSHFVFFAGIIYIFEYK